MDGEIISLGRTVIDIKNIYINDMIMRVCTLCLTKGRCREKGLCLHGFMGSFITYVQSQVSFMELSLL
jgi:hypothetical protein